MLHRDIYPKLLMKNLREFSTPNFRNKVGWIPSHAAVRNIWQKYVTKGAATNNLKGNVGRKKKQFEEEVEYVLTVGKMSAGQITKKHCDQERDITVKELPRH